MFEMDGYAPYTSALEMDLKASAKKVIDNIVGWFKKMIDKFTGLFKKEENGEKKNIFSKLISKLKALFGKAKNAKTAEEAVEAQEEAKEEIETVKVELNESEATAIKLKRNSAGDKSYKAINGAGSYDLTRSEANSLKLERNAKGDKRYKEIQECDEDDEDVEVEDIEVDDAVESYRKLTKLAGNEELKTAIENVSTNVDTNCTTADEAAAYLENIETEISKFNRDINTLKAASESMAAYGFDQNRFNTIAAPAVESLRNSFAQVGFTVNAASGIDQEACESMSYFLKTARNIISSKVDELAGNVAEDYAGEASFLATLTI